MTVAYIGLGSNLGDRRAALDAAVEALDWGATKVIARSSVYETEPVGGPADQPSFYNQVVAVETSLGPRELLDRCFGVEAALGRARASEVRWGPRVIDLDLLLYGDATIAEPDLVVPHPRIGDREFVLAPLVEIASEAVIPGMGIAREVLAARAARTDRSLIRRLG